MVVLEKMFTSLPRIHLAQNTGLLHKLSNRKNSLEIEFGQFMKGSDAVPYNSLYKDQSTQKTPSSLNFQNQGLQSMKYVASF